MSRLNDLIRQVGTKDEALAADLRREVAALADRRAFGLNFERHQPEAVELPGRPVRKGDKVRILPPRGEMPKKSDEKLWRVTSISKSDEERVAQLVDLLDGEESAESNVDDLVVVAEFRDPIYPGLVSTGKVERGGDKPYHAVINAENYHALQALMFTHRGKVDCIYIDPPYNTGAKDWKYNNDYIEGDDLYRHSKWLAFMERRLLLAKDLLNPEDSVLIVTIDEKEYLRLGLLLEQVFPEARIQMVSIAISPPGAKRDMAFRRSDEYAFFVSFGTAAPVPVNLGVQWEGSKKTTTTKLRWVSMIRSGTGATRVDRPGMFFPIFIDANSGAFVSVGESLPLGVSRQDIEAPPGAVSVWPIREDGTEGRWQVGPQTARSLRDSGFLRIGSFKGSDTAISYLKAGEQKKVTGGVFGDVTMSQGGFVEVGEAATLTERIPTTQWALASHSAAEYGSRLLRQILPARKFPFPKSLYAVEDSIRFYVKDKPSAVVVDFFAGSGTTAHALMRLNRQDNSSRISVSVTNNEVGVDEQESLRRGGFRPHDQEWENQGICDNITKPRMEAVITGKTPDGDSIGGNYKFTDEFAIADGLQENVEFFTLTYEAPLAVTSNREYGRIAPLLWLRAGSTGRRIDELTEGWDVSDSYGVLADLDRTKAFVAGLSQNLAAKIAFIVTDEDRLFESVVDQLPDGVEAVRLYEAYLRNFEIEAGRAAR